MVHHPRATHQVEEVEAREGGLEGPALEDKTARCRATGEAHPHPVLARSSLPVLSDGGGKIRRICTPCFEGGAEGNDHFPSDGERGKSPRDQEAVKRPRLGVRSSPRRRGVEVLHQCPGRRLARGECRERWIRTNGARTAGRCVSPERPCRQASRKSFTLDFVAWTATSPWVRRSLALHPAAKGGTGNGPRRSCLCCRRRR